MLPYLWYPVYFVHGNIILWFQNLRKATILVLRTLILLLAELQNRILQHAYTSTTDTDSCQQQEHHTVLLERHTEFCYSVMKELSITGSLNGRKFWNTDLFVSANRLQDICNAMLVYNSAKSAIRYYSHIFTHSLSVCTVETYTFDWFLLVHGNAILWTWSKTEQGS